MRSFHSAAAVRRKLALALVVTLGLLLPACTTPPGASTEPKTLVIGATIEPPTLDPTANAAAAIPQALLYNVYETLVKMDGEGNIKPLLAQRWDLSPDRLTLTFELDPQAAFATGEPVTAEAAAKALTHNMSQPSTKAELDVISSVTASDEATLVLSLKRPSNLLLYTLTSTGGIIADPAGFAQMSTTTAGSGPYALKAWNKGDSLVLASNAKYWGTPARFDEVTFRYFGDNANGMNAAMLAGDLDIISNVQAPQSIDQFSDTSRFSVIDGTSNGEVVLGFNHETKALQDVKVRQAINHAIDRQALIDTVWNGKGKLIGSMAVPTDSWFQDLSGTYAYDPDKASEMLKEAGYEKGLKLRLRVPTLPYATASAQFIQSQLKEVGIAVTIDELDFTRWLDQVYTKGNYDMTIVAHVEARDIGKFADETYYWHYDNADFAALITKADQGEPEQMNATMAEAAKMLADDAAADWLFMMPNLLVIKSDITGVNENEVSLSFDLATIARRS